MAGRRSAGRSRAAAPDLTYLLLTSQLVTAGVFALAVIGKLRAPATFAASLADFGLLPARAHRPVAYAVMAAEAAVVPLVLIPATAAFGLAFGASLLAGFAAAVRATLRRGRRPRCRCFGTASAALRGAHVARNVVLALLAVAGAIVAPRTGAALDAAPLAVAGLIAFVALAALATFDDLVEVLAPRSH